MLFILIAHRILRNPNSVKIRLKIQNAVLRATLLHQQLDRTVGHCRDHQRCCSQANTQLIHRTLLALLALETLNRETSVLQQHFVSRRIKATLGLKCRKSGNTVRQLLVGNPIASVGEIFRLQLAVDQGLERLELKRLAGKEFCIDVAAHHLNERAALFGEGLLINRLLNLDAIYRCNINLRRTFKVRINSP